MDFKVCSNHILVEMTVLVIFTKIGLSFASFWVMMRLYWLYLQK